MTYPDPEDEETFMVAWVTVLIIVALVIGAVLAGRG